MKYTIPFIILFSLLSGCTTPKDTVIHSDTNLPQLKNKIEKNEMAIVNKSTDIIKETNVKTPQIPLIKSKATEIKDIATQNLEEYKQLNDVQAKVIELENINKELEKEIEKKDSELKNGMAKINIMAYGLAMAAIIAGITLLFLDIKKVGTVILITGITTLGLVYALVTWAWLISGIAAILFICVLIGIAFKIFNDHGIMVQLVKSYEIIKNKTKYETEEKAEILKVQSDATIAKVDEIKKNLLIQP